MRNQSQGREPKGREGEGRSGTAKKQEKARPGPE